MRLGLITPVLTLNPRIHNSWERDGTFDDVVCIVETADRLGLHHVTCSEHVAVPVAYEPTRGARYWDALATFGFLAARTTSIRLATHVLVLGYHHPLEIAKRYGTLDRISEGRLVLGVGVGTLEAEFDLLGVPMSRRGERADDALAALRACLGRSHVEYHGEHYDFADLRVEPHASREDVPIWVGGRTRRSLRRAVELADGWAPFGLKRSDLASWLGGLDLPERFEVVAQPAAVVDPTGDLEAVDELLEQWATAGATVVDLHLAHHSLEHYLEQIHALAS